MALDALLRDAKHRGDFGYATDLDDGEEHADTSLDQPVGAALGAQAGFAKLSSVIRDGGFTHVRKATETPFNMILEAQP